MKQNITNFFFLLLVLVLFSSSYGCARNSEARSAGNFPNADQAAEEGILQRNIRQNENRIMVELNGATEVQVTEVFGKVVNTAQGVTSAKRYASQIVTDDPQACYVTWSVTIDQTDPFRLQTNIMKMIDDIITANGSITLKGIPYRYSQSETALLKGIRPEDATSRMIRFVVDRELMRDREFSGR